jgi:tetracycline resistance efflux pump
MDSPSAISLLPPIVVMAVAIWLKRPILALMVGSIVGLLLLSPSETLGNLAEISVAVMQDETIGWIILVCAGFGALINLLIQTGGALAFGSFGSKVAKGPRSSMFMTFVLGCIIFIDDYLNALSVGEAMKRVTDKYKVSRQMLAYIVDSTAAPICVIIPISTWAVFFGGLLVDNGIAESGKGIEVYIQAIPYMFYPWFAVLIVMLVSLRLMPELGPMKKAEEATRAGKPFDCELVRDINKSGPSALKTPEGSDHFAVQAIEQEFNNSQPQAAHHIAMPHHTSDEYAVNAIEDEFDAGNHNGKLHNFIVPMLALIGFTVYFDIDVWKGLICTLLLTIPFYGFQRVLTVNQMMEGMMDGFKTMLPAISTVIAAFIFKDVCDKLLLPQFVIDNLTPYMSAAMLPALVFVAMAILSFATGSSWGIFAVSIPIVMPLATAVGADIPLVIGALLSASSFGSQACFYSDSTVLAAQGSGCDLISHAVTQLPYCLLAASLAFVGFIVIAM